ncbi:MAG: family 43 glycosylhydrolase [Acidobacteriota bacterium]|nr:MAG: family 43 glycosylhydrolase [Acidobacteriota bacterium]
MTCANRVRSAITLAALALATYPLAVAADSRVNPLEMTTPGGERVESCADPTVIRSQQPGEDAWYMYCTADPLGDWDREPGGGYVYHLIPVLRSTDLVHWRYEGDALSERPSWAWPLANLWAPEIQYFNGLYYLYFSVTDTRASVSGETNCGSDSAIGVATSTTPTGPFTNAGSPVVEPRRNGSGCDFLATIDPEVTVDDAGQRYIYYGSFYGGTQVRELSADGRSSSPSTAVQIAAWDRFEAPEVVRHEGDYVLLLSAAGCCNGPLSGYLVYAGRSTSPTGPFVDRDGVSLNTARVGGTPVLAATGNRWVGPGHNTVVTDLAGQHWTIYHAIDVDAPYFADSVGFTKRPAMMDPLDWVEGWPTVRGGWWVSDCPQPVPVAISGEPPDYTATFFEQDEPGALIPELSDEFDSGLGPQWSWVREPAAGSWGVESGALRFDTQAADLFEDSDSASVLVEPVPETDFVVEAHVLLDVPASGCCYNYRQAGLVLYGDDDNYQKLVHVSIWGTRVTEWAKELAPVPAGYPRYDKSFVGPPADGTYLRIVRRAVFGGEQYTAYTSRDGTTWTRGSTWQHGLGPTAKIGLVSMGGDGYTARFQFVRVYELAPRDCSDPSLADPCDSDGDGLGDACDPDDDGDLIGDLEDCASRDPSAGRPTSITGVSVSENAVSWNASPTADLYDISRSSLAELAAGQYGPCLADDWPDTSLDDPETPPAGSGFGYLVRGIDLACGGGGTWGTDSSGTERENNHPQACP